MCAKIWCVSITEDSYDSGCKCPSSESYFTTLEAANEYYEKTRYFDAEIGLYECSVKEFKVCQIWSAR